MKKKLLVLLVAMAMVIGLAAPSAVQAASKKGYEIEPYNEEINIFVGEESSIYYELYKDGEYYDIYYDDDNTEEVVVASANSKIASVDGNYVKGVKAGSTTITIKFADASATIKVNVFDAGFAYNSKCGVTEITIPSNMEVCLDYFFASKPKISLSDKKVFSYSISDYSEDGYRSSLYICPLKTGKCVITAKAGKVTSKITVNVIAPIDIRISPVCSWNEFNKKKTNITGYSNFSITNNCDSEIKVISSPNEGYDEHGYIEMLKGADTKLAKGKSADISLKTYSYAIEKEEASYYSTDKRYDLGSYDIYLTIEYQGNLYDVSFAESCFVRSISVH